MQQNSRIFQTLIVGLSGAIIGSFAMMVYASSHFTGVAGPGNTPPVVGAASLSYGSDQDRIIAAVKHVSPSVVAINVTINERRFVPTNPLAQMFGGESDGQYRTFRQPASGSGFVYSRDGLIITNAHVVPKGTTKIEVVFRDGDKVPARVWGRNVGADLALIKVDNYSKLPPPVDFGDSTKLQAGQWAIAIGEPFELKESVSLGVVSGFNRSEAIGAENGGYQEFSGLLQTSAPINPGNSGGPLIDLDGRLIGVNQSTANPQAGAQGIGFAIPANTVRDQIALIDKNPGKTVETGLGYLGVSLITMTPEARVQFNGYKGTGVGVAQVSPGSPAMSSGLEPGDVIERINGKDITKAEDATAIIKALKPGSDISMSVWSAGAKKLVSTKVAERPAVIGAPDPQQQQQQGDPSGGDQQPGQ